jgi:hypothetical protein
MIELNKFNDKIIAVVAVKAYGVAMSGQGHDPATLPTEENVPLPIEY